MRGTRRRARWVVVGLALSLVLGPVVAWYRVAQHRVEQVDVSWVGAPECDNADVVSYTENQPVPGEEPWSGPVIEAERGMRCVITVEVRNRSGGDVHLDHALLSFMGPGGGAVIKADTTVDTDVWATPRGSDIDTLRLLDVTLRPGQTTTFDIPLVFRENGCSGGPDGGRGWVDGFPTVAVTSLGRTFDRPAADDLAHRQVSPSRGCGLMARG